jgi:hypothetical protein
MVCFQTKNPNFGKIWRALEWKMLLYFYDHGEYFTVIWYNLWPFGVVCCHLVYCLRFGIFGPRKICQPWTGHRNMLVVMTKVVNYFYQQRARQSKLGTG